MEKLHEEDMEGGISPALLQAIQHAISNNCAKVIIKSDDMNQCVRPTDNTVFLIQNDSNVEMFQSQLADNCLSDSGCFGLKDNNQMAITLLRHEDDVSNGDAEDEHMIINPSLPSYANESDVPYAVSTKETQANNMSNVLSAIADKVQRKKMPEASLPIVMSCNGTETSSLMLDNQSRTVQVVEAEPDQPGTTIIIPEGMSIPPGGIPIDGGSIIQTEEGTFAIAHADCAVGFPVNADGTPGPCPVCGDRISGYHYGIYTCESCKGFFKRTCQNKKVYVCHRKGQCNINIGNRKKCPACRFKRCLNSGMKLECIREDRSRGGRSPLYGNPSMKPKQLRVLPQSTSDAMHIHVPCTPQALEELVTLECALAEDNSVEHSCCPGRLHEGQHTFDSLLHVADHCLYKMVRWARNLPDFGDICTDDQILLLQSCWAELLCLNICHASVKNNVHSDALQLAFGKILDLDMAKRMGLTEVMQRMLEHVASLRQLEVDVYEFVALKALVILSPDIKGLQNRLQLVSYQEKTMDCLFTYTSSHYPHMRNKVSVLLLKLAEMTRTCTLAKEMLTLRQRVGDVPSNSLLSELLKGEPLYRTALNEGNDSQNLVQENAVTLDSNLDAVQEIIIGDTEQ